MLITTAWDSSYVKACIRTVCSSCELQCDHYTPDTFMGPERTVPIIVRCPHFRGWRCMFKILCIIWFWWHVSIIEGFPQFRVYIRQVPLECFYRARTNVNKFRLSMQWKWNPESCTEPCRIRQLTVTAPQRNMQPWCGSSIALYHIWAKTVESV